MQLIKEDENPPIKIKSLMRLKGRKNQVPKVK
jgi:hypothetical protein